MPNKTPTPRVPTFQPADCTEPSPSIVNDSESENDLPHVATIDLIDVAPSAVIERRVKLTDTAMVIDPESTFEECVSLYDFTHTIRERGRWWLGDIVNFMEDHFPEKYSQAIDLSGLSYSRLTTICSVCRRIEPARRRQDASFTWHEKVAYLPPQSADYLLDRGIKEKWTNEQFEDSVARAKGEPTKAEKRAAKESKPGSTAAKVAASGKTPQVPEGEKPLIWNGHPLRVMTLESDGVKIRSLWQGDFNLTPTEADQAAHHHKFNHKEGLMNWLEEHNFIKPEGGEQTKCDPKTSTTPNTEEGPANGHVSQSETDNGGLPKAGAPQVGAAPNATESAPTPDPLEALLNQSAPEGQLWKCPDCDVFAILGGDAAFHVSHSKHRMPVLVATPFPAAPPAPTEPPKATETPKSVADEILAIMATYHEQEARGDIDTPGGLEHMGDVWSLLLKWESALRRESSASEGASIAAPAIPMTPIQRAEEAILRFNEASKAVDWAEVGRNALRRVKWLGAEGSPGLLNRPDEIIDILQKNPPTPRK